jgi:hypothetical protein
VTLPRKTLDEINGMIRFLVETGLAEDQNFSFLTPLPDRKSQITFGENIDWSIILLERQYRSLYEDLVRERWYSAKLADGALIQISYIFVGNQIERHRLAFLPSPDLERFQTDPDLYTEDVIYADIVSPGVFPAPLRFDFDLRAEVVRDIEHPASHCTVGQYKNCRIPVTSAISPRFFIEFILRNFYHTAHLKFADQLPGQSTHLVFDKTISLNEMRGIHIAAPHR